MKAKRYPDIEKYRIEFDVWKDKANKMRVAYKKGYVTQEEFKEFLKSIAHE